jgi:hypothetical protein
MPTNSGERRRSRRFPIELPVEIRKIGSKTVDMTGQTRDVSSVGARFTIPTEDVREGTAIEFLVTLQGSMLDMPAIGDVRLRCRGRIIRQEELSESANRGRSVAATIDRYQFIRDSSDE